MAKNKQSDLIAFWDVRAWPLFMCRQFLIAFNLCILMCISAFWSNFTQLERKEQKFWVQAFATIVDDWTNSQIYTSLNVQKSPCEPGQE
jgi:hypothetical protein